MEQQYTAENIQALEGLEAVRKRPGMYIGSTGVRGLNQLFYEIIDNSIDEALAGHCKKINVTILKDGGIEVVDDGRGIPVDIHPKFNVSALEVVMTKLHAGGKFDKESYKVSGGLHGVGISVVNALSEKLIVAVYRNGKIWEQEYSRGAPLTKLKELGTSEKTGTSVRFYPDFTIMEKNEFNFDYLSSRLRELAFLNAGVEITIKDERVDKSHFFKFEGGIVSFVKFLNENKEVLHEPIFFNKKIDNIDAEIAIQYNQTYNSNIFSFVNNINTIEGGTHLNGFKTAITRVCNKYAKENKITDVTLTGEDVREGLTAVISIKIPEPQFEGQTKTKLGNSEVKGIVDAIVNEGLSNYFEENPSIAKIVLQKSSEAARVRDAAKKARDLARKKGGLESGSLPGKLSDCSTRDPQKAEIFLVEGDSAGGTARGGRNREFQAILPVFGKVLNVEKARLHKILSSEKLRTIIAALGTNVGEEFNIDKLRYKKIILMSDSDVDGSHIRILYLTLFYRYFKPIIDNGYLYIAQPPLYLIKKGKVKHYALNDKEKNEMIKKLGDDVAVQRYKGLGEMNADQLWETTMNPETRTLIQININDAVEADSIFTMLMGEKVEARKAFIQEHAKSVANLDV